jgi:hypothetical protein
MEDVVINICGYEVILSACDVERVMAHNWYVCDKRGKNPYFRYEIYKPQLKRISLHRFITNCPAGMQVDHINLNTLDNRRENLRICTHKENSRNYPKPKNNTSGYKGVCWFKYKKRWKATIHVNKKTIHLGFFDTPEEAYKAYCEASKKYHGEFGRIA